MKLIISYHLTFITFTEVKIIVVTVPRKHSGKSIMRLIDDFAEDGLKVNIGYLSVC